MGRERSKQCVVFFQWTKEGFSKPKLSLKDKSHKIFFTADWSVNSRAPSENIVQNHLHKALVNVF